jgi:GT2 family glycosyltransferase
MLSIAKKKRVAIVTPVHNRCDLTLLCLRSLARLYISGLEVFTVIVDDGSTDDTAERVRSEFPDVEIVEGDGNLWFSGGMNRGFEAALRRDPDYILSINNDTVFDRMLLQNMIETAERHPRSIVGALLLLWDQPHRVFQVAPKWNALWGGFRHWQQQTVWTVPGRPWKVEIIVGNCVLFPVEAIRECGLMDEKRFPHYGDAEYTPRMRRAGWTLLIDPRARAFCQPNTPPPSVGKLPFGKKLRTLFFDKGNANSLWRRTYANLYGAPNKFSGLFATPIFYVRYLIGRNYETSYAEVAPEPHLKELYADKVVAPEV